MFIGHVASVIMPKDIKSLFLSNFHLRVHLTRYFEHPVSSCQQKMSANKKGFPERKPLKYHLLNYFLVVSAGKAGIVAGAATGAVLLI